jgi:hypothetical protein
MALQYDQSIWTITYQDDEVRMLFLPINDLVHTTRTHAQATVKALDVDSINEVVTLQLRHRKCTCSGDRDCQLKFTWRQVYEARKQAYVAGLDEYEIRRLKVLNTPRDGNVQPESQPHL